MNKQRRMHKLKIINTFISFTNLYRNLDKYSKKKKNSIAICIVSSYKLY